MGDISEILQDNSFFLGGKVTFVYIDKLVHITLETCVKKHTAWYLVVWGKYQI